MSKDEGYSEPIDSWTTSADEITCNEQQITSNKKGKFSAFGEAVVSSGRAEWDLQIDLESYGAICIGVYKHSKLTSKNNLGELPVNDNFAKTENGWGFTNKTGVILHNGERKKYGSRFKANDTLTMSLDLLAGTLTYSINGESQGLAYDVPRGAYRLACTLPFKEQQVSITRFWTSIERSASNNSTATSESNTSNNNLQNGEASVSSTEANDGASSTSEAKESDGTKSDSLKPIATESDLNDNDDNSTDENYDFDKNDQSPTAEESREVSRSLKQMAKSQSKEATAQVDESEPLEMIGGGVSRVRGGSITANAEVSGSDDSSDASDPNNAKDILVKSKVGGVGSKSKSPPEPINVPVKDDEESSDYFSVAGSNLSTEKAGVLSCIREAKGVPHTGFGAQLVTHGRTEWILKVLKGNRIIIGVSGTTSNSDGLFTKNEFGFGYCDDGNIYTKHGYIEYNNGFKSGDTVGVHLDMESGDLRFSVNKIDQGPAFKGLNSLVSKNSDDDENGIDGYRLAVSLQYRPHSVQLLESTSWSSKRMSPRPGTSDLPDWSFTVPHQRKHSWMSSKKNPLTSKEDEKTSDEDGDDTNESGGSKSEGARTPEKSSKNGGSSSGKSSKTSKKDENGSKSSKKTSNTLMETKSSRKLNESSGNSDKKMKRPKSARKAPKSPRGGMMTLQPSKYKNLGGNEANANWKLRSGSTDVWERSGSKLEVNVNKSSVSAKHDIKDGNSAIGKLIVSNNMKVQWDIRIDQGSRVTVGIMNMDGKSQTAMRKMLNSFFTNDLYGYGYFGNDGGIARNGRFKKYGDAYKRGDTVSVILDLFNKTLSFLKNDEDQGVAFKNIPFGEYRVAIAIPKNRHKITLTKIQIWDASPETAAESNSTETA